jgi:hypothetical protein
MDGVLAAIDRIERAPGGESDADADAGPEEVVR